MMWADITDPGERGQTPELDRLLLGYLFSGMGQPWDLLHFLHLNRQQWPKPMYICVVQWRHETFPELKGESCFCHIDRAARIIQRAADDRV